jgi:hypothetical protein
MAVAPVLDHLTPRWYVRVMLNDHASGPFGIVVLTFLISG